MNWNDFLDQVINGTTTIIQTTRSSNNGGATTTTIAPTPVSQNTQMLGIALLVVVLFLVIK
jgi:hypothetical protein